MITEEVYIDRDNAISFLLKKKPPDEDEFRKLTSDEMADITRVKVRYNGKYYDSDDYPTLFDWSSYADIGVLTFKMGTMVGLEAGIDRNAELIIYNTANPNGIVWDTFRLKVLDDAEE